MKRYLIFLFFAILPVLQSNAQVVTQYIQEGDTICFVQAMKVRTSNKIAIE